MTTGPDMRRPEASFQGLRLRTAGADRVLPISVDGNERIGEPGLTVRFVNRRNRKDTIVRLDDQERLPTGFVLRGQSGDTFTVRISDGVHNTDLRRIWTSLVVGEAPGQPPIGYRSGAVDPGLSRPQKSVRPGRMLQGAVGDCWLLTVLKALGPALPTGLVRLHADGTATVRFHARDEKTGRRKLVPVRVDTRLPTDQGARLFAGGDLRIALVEKAYAKWKGSYETLECGYPEDAFAILLGNPGVHTELFGKTPEAALNLLRRALKERRAIVATTKPLTERRFSGSGFLPDHCYTVLGIELRDGVDHVRLCNPWGDFEPKGNGRDDGIFSVSLAVFLRYFTNVVYSA